MTVKIKLWIWESNQLFDVHVNKVCLNAPACFSLAPSPVRVSSGYDFAEVLRWFGERVDRIILLFDAHKLDISDEFSEAIRALKGQDDKIRVVLNKADQVRTLETLKATGRITS